MEASAIVLAGGKSTRMGKNKAMLPINGQANIVRIKEELATVFKQMVLVTNDIEKYHFLNIPIVEDKVKDKGPLAGIQAGLTASATEVNLIVACDMPFISTKLAQALIEYSKGFDAVVPVIAGIRHPLFAIYKKNILPKVSECLNNNQLRIKFLLDQINVNYVTEDQLAIKEIDNLEQVFYNMNHPLEYEEVLKIASLKEEEGG